jgi:hypothetical protein
MKKLVQVTAYPGGKEPDSPKERKQPTAHFNPYQGHIGI